MTHFPHSVSHDKKDRLPDARMHQYSDIITFDGLKRDIKLYFYLIQLYLNFKEFEVDIGESGDKVAPRSLPLFR